MSHKRHFTRSLGAAPGRLHFAVHSHHLWPDVTFEAQQQAWLDAATLADAKWTRVLDEVLPRVQQRIARVLSWPDPAGIAVAPNTHELFVRIATSLQVDRPLRVLSTDGEFHSFERQARRWEEIDLARVERVPTEPFHTLPQRLGAAAERGHHDLLYLSQVFFDSGFAISDLEEIVEAVPDPDTLVLIDGYHGFMALPVDLGCLAQRIFYLAGGYKYAMAGEGICFACCPPEYVLRPVDTGWFATFGTLDKGLAEGRLAWSLDGYRLMGATFDPTGLYRMDAALGLLEELEITVADIHDHVLALQEAFLEGLDHLAVEGLGADTLIPPRGTPRGHFLTFRTPLASFLQQALMGLDVITDRRGDRLRVGFGLYHDAEDVAELLDRLGRLA